jgi:hypothetical protein
MSASRPRQFDDSFARHLGPRYLSVVTEGLRNDSPFMQLINRCTIINEGSGYKTILVDDWNRATLDSKPVELRYALVSYTRQQFQTYTEEDMDEWSLPEDPEKRQAELDKRASMLEKQPYHLAYLCEIGKHAAKDLGVPAFWIDVVCMDKWNMEEDVHRICDVVRGAEGMVIAIKERVLRLSNRPSSEESLLQNWAQRLWTLPEMLLARNNEFKVYRHYSGKVKDFREKRLLAKRNIAEQVYSVHGIEDDPSKFTYDIIEDAKWVQMLIDHYEGSLIMTPLELITIGLQCLQHRGTTDYAKGDLAYALMTLLRRRPEPKKNEPKFVAFAKLSLLNDSNMLLERLICVLPPKRGQDWVKIEDYWKVKLWDIYPICQVSAIADEKSIILDGAYGASITWDRLEKVAYIKRQIVWRIVVDFAIRLGPVWFLIGIITLAENQKEKIPGFSTVNSTLLTGIVFFIFGLVIFFITPWWLYRKYTGKFESTQALFYGIEGEIDLETLEKALFGFNANRLKWSPYGSTLSRHHRRSHGKVLEDGECEGDVPSTEELPLAVSARGEHVENQRPNLNSIDEETIFTLVDTYSLTVTRFRAVRPPSVVLICGHEGGMQRALLCSYNYRSQTFHRETILRMKTLVLDRMQRVDKFRFAMDGLPLHPKLAVDATTN